MTETRRIACPICSNLVASEPRTEDFPFCSPRCKTIDLGRWLDQRYTVDMRTGKMVMLEEGQEVEEVDLDNEDDLSIH